MKDTNLYIVGALFYICAAVYESNSDIESAKIYNLLGAAFFLMPIVFALFKK